MKKTFRNAIIFLKLHFLEMKCLLQMKSPRILSRQPTWALAPAVMKPCTEPRGSCTHGRGGASEASKREWRCGGAGLYFDLLGIRFQPTTEISPNDEMHLLNFKFLLPDWRLTSAQQIPIHPRLFRGAGRPRKALQSFLKLSGQRFRSCHRLLAREAATLQAWYRKWELATGG